VRRSSISGGVASVWRLLTFTNLIAIITQNCDMMGSLSPTDAGLVGGALSFTVTCKDVGFVLYLQLQEIMHYLMILRS